MTFYNKNWKMLPYHYTNKHKKPFKKPKNLKKLLNLGEILSKGFKFVRVDFYILNNDSIKFGEMTFHPYSGIQKWESKMTYEIIGEKIKINLNKKYEELKKIKLYIKKI